MNIYYVTFSQQITLETPPKDGRGHFRQICYLATGKVCDCFAFLCVCTVIFVLLALNCARLGALYYCACFHTENFFVTCQIFIHLPSKYESSAPQEEMFSDQPMKGHMPSQVAAT